MASYSKARRKLFSIFGLKFIVLPSRIPELDKPIQRSFPALVKANALAKARCVSERVKDGIIIAADTITVQDNKVFGKPADLKEAHRMLKALSRKPQWLYTGIAVIDKNKGKIKVGFEKTRVYMDRLTDKEIRQYFLRVSPLDKAGGFDIQGKGAFFIRRVEGCFYNVVGLPLRRLYRMLKVLGVEVFGLVLCFFLAGCSTEYNLATKQEEVFYYNYSTEKEVQMGLSIARQVEKQYKLVSDPLIQKRVEDIGEKIVAVCDRKDIDYSFRVLDDDEVNAASLPGGIIYVNKGLIDKVDNDDELAGVLAHEVGHIVARHSIKKLQAVSGYSILRILVAAAPQSGEAGAAADAAFTEIILGYSREDELLADQLSARYAKAAGYNPQAMLTFLKKLQDINRRKPLAPKSYYKTHPYVPDRVRVVKQELGQKIDFDDYINTQDKPHE